MRLTPEQSSVLDYIKATPEPPIILVSSVAGSGKTTLLTAIAKSIKHTNGMYMAYNKSIAVESQPKFPSTTKCITTHALAYRSIVVPAKYKIGSFTYRNIDEKIKYELKCRLVDYIREFCLSKYTSFNEFAEDYNIIESNVVLANKYLTLMERGKIDCTHEFYLKLFHIYLDKGEVEFDPFDFIMIDEAGDLNEVTLEIFRLLPSKLKIAVGDPYQNIYTFNHTINCFDALKEEGKLFKMSISFRVDTKIAERIQAFCKEFLDPEMEFYGTSTDGAIDTYGYITRTNAALIARMIELNERNTAYGLVRRATEIFKLPLMLASVKYQGFITDPNYKHLQEYFDEWHESEELRKNHKSPLAYIAFLFEDDVQLTQSIRLIAKYGKQGIFDAYKEAANHEGVRHNLTLCTAHSAKGLEFDEVVIDSSLNDMVSKALMGVQAGTITEFSQEYKDAINLYYVACSRAKKSLVNAVALDLTF